MMKKCLLPKIRFPAFVKDGEWFCSSLEEVISMVNPPKKIQTGDYQSKGKFPIVDQSQKFVSGYSDDASALINEVGESLIVFGDHTCILKKVAFPFIQGADGIKIFKSKNENFLDSLYLYQYLLYNSIESKEYKRHFSELKEKKITFPKSLLEQKKIADLLSSVDAKVYATQEKLEELREQKIGMLQKLFPRNGKNIPDYRFSEFKNDGEWQNGCLGDFASFFKGKGISKSEVSDDGNIPCIRYGELYTRYHEMVKDVKSHTVLSPENLFFSQKNDVIIPATGETAEDISTASYLPLDGIALGGDINVVRSNCDGLFLAYYLSHIKKNDIAKIAHGFAIVHLHAEKLSKLKVQIPSLPEQKKIAQAILSVDELISLCMEKKDQLIQYKKGLVQRLFA